MGAGKGRNRRAKAATLEAPKQRSSGMQLIGARVDWEEHILYVQAGQLPSRRNLIYTRKSFPASGEDLICAESSDGFVDFFVQNHEDTGGPINTTVLVEDDAGDAEPETFQGCWYVPGDMVARLDLPACVRVVFEPVGFSPGEGEEVGYVNIETAKELLEANCPNAELILREHSLRDYVLTRKTTAVKNPQKIEF